MNPMKKNINLINKSYRQSYHQMACSQEGILGRSFHQCCNVRKLVVPGNLSQPGSLRIQLRERSGEAARASPATGEQTVAESPHKLQPVSILGVYSAST